VTTLGSSAALIALFGAGFVTTAAGTLSWGYLSMSSADGSWGASDDRPVIAAPPEFALATAGGC
jgi:hypothetical protein